jgi:serine phosphatase RsbU (regulator of sigma subunit)
VLLAERGDDERFATVAMVSLDPQLSEAQVVTCGHPTPLLMRGSEVCDLAVAPLPMLTLLQGATIETSTVGLDANWGLLLFTDGLVEGRAIADAPERLGVAELARVLQSHLTVGTPCADLAPALVAEAERRHGGPLTDDVAVLVVGSLDWWH